jgi:hypothetical protein
MLDEMKLLKPRMGATLEVYERPRTYSQRVSKIVNRQIHIGIQDFLNGFTSARTYAGVISLREGGTVNRSKCWSLACVGAVGTVAMLFTGTVGSLSVSSTSSALSQLQVPAAKDNPFHGGFQVEQTHSWARVPVSLEDEVEA